MTKRKPPTPPVDVEQQIREHAARLAQQAPAHITEEQALLIRKVFTTPGANHAA